jgi:hypothetical protein
VSRQVRDENAMPRGERGRESSPVLDRPAEPVDENERRAMPAGGVAKPRPTPFELALLESP